MTVSPIKSSFLRALIVAGAVFSGLTLPLAIVGSEPIMVQIQKEPVFQGKIRDIAAPYLVFATILSLGVGVSAIAASEWRKSSRRFAQMEEALADLQENLKQKETELAVLKLTPCRVKAAGLGFFLAESVAITATSVQKKTITPIIPITPNPPQS